MYAYYLAQCIERKLREKNVEIVFKVKGFSKITGIIKPNQYN